MLGLSGNSYLFPPVTSLYCVLLLLSNERRGNKKEGVEKEKEKDREREGRKERDSVGGILLNTQLSE